MSRWLKLGFILCSQTVSSYTSFLWTSSAVSSAKRPRAKL